MWTMSDALHLQSWASVSDGGAIVCNTGQSGGRPCLRAWVKLVAKQAKPACVVCLWMGSAWVVRGIPCSKPLPSPKGRYGCQL
jgi:hypothetical protein